MIAEMMLQVLYVKMIRRAVVTLNIASEILEV
jgi:hypothetical protein